MRIGEKFGPHPHMKKVYFIYLLMVAAPLLGGGVAVTLVVLSYAPSPTYALIPLLGWVLPVLGVVCFVSYWIPKFYRSISYLLTRDEVVVERGVWFKFKHVIPYARIMSVDVVQGPISRRLGVGTVDVFTAGYTGAGGTAGPGTRRAEATILCIQNFLEVRDAILGLVREKPLFGPRGEDVGPKILEELRAIRRALQR